MKKLNSKDALLAVLLGVIGISSGIAMATVMQVVVAPPIQALPLPVVNIAWALVFSYLIRHDVRVGYIGCILLGISVIILPIVVFFDIIGQGPTIVPAHFAGITTDMILGIALIIAAVRALRGSNTQP
jgi:hypothetical protein